MTRSRCAHDYTLNLEEWVGHQQRAAILTHRRQAFYNLAYFFRGFQLPSMPMMPFSSPFFLPTQLRLGIVPLLRRVARRWFGRVSRILVHPLLQFVHLFFQRLDILPKLNDDRWHRGWRHFPIFWRDWHFRRTIHCLQFTSCLPVSLLLTITHYIANSPSIFEGEFTFIRFRLFKKNRGQRVYITKNALLFYSRFLYTLIAKI